MHYISQHIALKSVQSPALAGFCEIIKAIAQSEPHRMRISAIMLQPLVNLCNLDLQKKSILSRDKQKLLESASSTLWKILSDEETCRKALNLQIVEYLCNILQYGERLPLSLTQNVCEWWRWRD